MAECPKEITITNTKLDMKNIGCHEHTKYAGKIRGMINLPIVFVQMYLHLWHNSKNPAHAVLECLVSFTLLLGQGVNFVKRGKAPL